MADKNPWPLASYRLTQRAYMARTFSGAHEMLEAGETVLYQGRPGPHMEPLDDEGRKAHLRAGDQTLDFTSKLDMTIGEGDSMVKPLQGSGETPSLKDLEAARQRAEEQRANAADIAAREAAAQAAGPTATNPPIPPPPAPPPPPPPPPPPIG